MIEITQEQFDRMMRAVRFVESMQRGPVRGQEIPEQPVAPPAAEVFIKITGPEDEAFKPEDEDSKYFPCVLTEKIVLSTEDEAIYGPLDSYWRDLDGEEDEEGRAFALNGGDLISGSRYKATVVEMHDGQYPVLSVDTGGVSEVLQVQAGGANDYGYPARVQQWSPITAAWIDASTTEVRVEDPNGGTWAEDDYVVAKFVGLNLDGVACYAAVPPGGGSGGTGPLIDGPLTTSTTGTTSTILTAPNLITFPSTGIWLITAGIQVIGPGNNVGVYGPYESASTADITFQGFRAINAPGIAYLWRNCNQYFDTRAGIATDNFTCYATVAVAGTKLGLFFQYAGGNNLSIAGSSQPASGLTALKVSELP